MPICSCNNIHISWNHTGEYPYYRTRYISVHTGEESSKSRNLKRSSEKFAWCVLSSSSCGFLWVNLTMYFINGLSINLEKYLKSLVTSKYLPEVLYYFNLWCILHLFLHFCTKYLIYSCLFSGNFSFIGSMFVSSNWNLSF